MWNRFEVKQNGLRAFKANYWLCVAMAFILGICEGGGGSSASNAEMQQAGDPSSFSGVLMQSFTTGMILIVGLLGFAIIIFLLSPLAVGCRRFFLVNQLQPASFDNIKYGFTSNYKNIVVVEFLTSLFILLWALLFIIPGIIKYYEYRMVDYILCEDPNIDYREAQAKSKAMMMGNKMDAFMYDLSFIGWYLVGIITCGLGLIFYVSPYKASSDAALYIAIRNCTDIMSSGNGYSPEAETTTEFAKDVEFDVE